MTDSTLPPLPKPYIYLDGTDCPVYEEDDLEAYATTAVNEARSPLLAEIERLKAQVGELSELLDIMFYGYENGTSCYEDPDDFSGYLGNAFRIDDEVFHRIADILNELRPRGSDASAAAMKEKKE